MPEETTTAPEPETTTETTTAPPAETTEAETKPETTTAEAKPAEPKPAEPAAPEPVTFDTLEKPADIEIPDEFQGKFTDILNNTEMSASERGNALLGLYAEAAKFASERGSEAFVQMQETWKESIAEAHKKTAAEDSILGGKDMAQTTAQIGGLIERYGDDELREAFDLTGAGNNPAFYRFMVKIANELGEAAPVTGSPGGVPLSQAEKMFPSMNKG